MYEWGEVDRVWRGRGKRKWKSRTYFPLGEHVKSNQWLWLATAIISFIDVISQTFANQRLICWGCFVYSKVRCISRSHSVSIAIEIVCIVSLQGVRLRQKATMLSIMQISVRWKIIVLPCSRSSQCLVKTKRYSVGILHFVVISNRGVSTVE